MATPELIQLYLKSLLPHNDFEDVVVTNYRLNGSTLRIVYSHTTFNTVTGPVTKFNKIKEVELLDYITWVYNQCRISG